MLNRMAEEYLGDHIKQRSLKLQDFIGGVERYVGSNDSGGIPVFLDFDDLDPYHDQKEIYNSLGASMQRSHERIRKEANYLIREVNRQTAEEDREKVLEVFRGFAERLKKDEMAIDKYMSDVLRLEREVMVMYSTKGSIGDKARENPVYLSMLADSLKSGSLETLDREKAEIVAIHRFFKHELSKIPPPELSGGQACKVSANDHAAAPAPGIGRVVFTSGTGIGFSAMCLTTLT
jgi:hypothetical protein